jgi:hypothetical protein
MVEYNTKQKVIKICVECGSRKKRYTKYGLCVTCYKREWRQKRSDIKIAERARLMSLRECYACGSKETCNKYGIQPQWYLNPPIGVLCNRCYIAIFRSTYNKEWWKSQKAQELKKKRKTIKESQDILTYYKRRGKIFSILEEYKCRRCNESDWRCLQLDHVNGGGSYFRKKIGGQSSMYSFYIRNPVIAKQELQVLCANCNIKKRYESGENRKFIESAKEKLEAGD